MGVGTGPFGDEAGDGLGLAGAAQVVGRGRRRRVGVGERHELRLEVGDEEGQQPPTPGLVEHLELEQVPAEHRLDGSAGWTSKRCDVTLATGSRDSTATSMNRGSLPSMRTSNGYGWASTCG